MKLFLSLLLIVSPAVSLASAQPRASIFTFNPGAIVSYNSIALDPEQAPANTLRFLLFQTALRVDIGSELQMEILVGYHSAHTRSPLDFSGLPVPLQWNRAPFCGMSLGLALASEPLSFSDFTLNLHAEFNVFPARETEWELHSVQTTGIFAAKSTFTLLSLDATLQYHGFTGIIFFAGPRLNLLHGKFTASQLLAGQLDSQEVSFRQKNLVGPLAGALVEIGDNLELILKAGLVSRSELSLTVFYTF